MANTPAFSPVTSHGSAECIYQIKMTCMQRKVTYKSMPTCYKSLSDEIELRKTGLCIAIMLALNTFELLSSNQSIV